MPRPKGRCHRKRGAAAGKQQPGDAVRDMVTHIVVETRQALVGTKWEGKGRFYHDALSLMTAKETTDWMKEMGAEGQG